MTSTKAGSRLFLALAAAVFAVLALQANVARAQMDKLVVAIGTAPPDLSLQTYYFALENGFYKQEGLDVTLMPFNGDATAMRAVVAGDADVAAGVGLAIPLRAIEAGSKLKVFLATSPKMDYLLVAQKDIANVKQFDGKTIGISGPGAVSYQVPLLMIKLAGGDPSKVKFINVGGSAARTLALIGKKIDGAVLNSSFASRTTKYDYLHVIGDAASDLPDFIYTVEVATDKTIQEKHRALQAFAIGTLRGAQWAMEHPEAAMAISQKILPDVPKDEIAAGLNHFAKVKYYNVSGLLSKKAWDFTVDELVKGNELKQPLKYEDYYLPEFSKVATEKLGAKR
jgi:NitT/TauT family transport system substrate-binding protein